jgi:hypothetical protein
MYSLEGLTHGIERCKINIGILKKSIKDEERTIADYKIMMDKIRKSEQQQEEAKANIHVEIVNDN